MKSIYGGEVYVLKNYGGGEKIQSQMKIEGLYMKINVKSFFINIDGS